MESRSVAEGEKGVLIHFDPLLYAKQTPQIAMPTKMASTSTRERSRMKARDELRSVLISIKQTMPTVVRLF